MDRSPVGKAQPGLPAAPQPKKLFCIDPDGCQETLAALSPDGTLAASLNKRDSVFRVRSVPTGSLVAAFPVPREAARLAWGCFARNSRAWLCVVPGTDRSALTLWDVEAGRALWERTVAGEARSPALTDRFLCLAEKGSRVCVYSLMDGAPLHSLWTV